MSSRVLCGWRLFCYSPVIYPEESTQFTLPPGWGPTTPGAQTALGPALEGMLPHRLKGVLKCIDFTVLLLVVPPHRGVRGGLRAQERGGCSGPRWCSGRCPGARRLLAVWAAPLPPACPQPAIKGAPRSGTPGEPALLGAEGHAVGALPSDRDAEVTSRTPLGAGRRPGVSPGLECPLPGVGEWRFWCPSEGRCPVCEWGFVSLRACFGAQGSAVQRSLPDRHPPGQDFWPAGCPAPGLAVNPLRGSRPLPLSSGLRVSPRRVAKLGCASWCVQGCDTRLGAFPASHNSGQKEQISSEVVRSLMSRCGSAPLHCWQTTLRHQSCSSHQRLVLDSA